MSTISNAVHVSSDVYFFAVSKSPAFNASTKDLTDASGFLSISLVTPNTANTTIITIASTNSATLSILFFILYSPFFLDYILKNKLVQHYCFSSLEISL